MKNNYLLALPLLIFVALAVFFLTSGPITEGSLDSTNCNCSGPKAFKQSDD